MTTCNSSWPYNTSQRTHSKVQQALLSHLLARCLLLYDCCQGVHCIVQGEGRLSIAGAVCRQVRHNHPAGGRGPSGKTWGWASQPGQALAAAAMTAAPRLLPFCHHWPCRDSGATQRWSTTLRLLRGHACNSLQTLKHESISADHTHSSLPAATGSCYLYPASASAFASSAMHCRPTKAPCTSTTGLPPSGPYTSAVLCGSQATCSRKHSLQVCTVCTTAEQTGRAGPAGS
jgi:hypothetical protein